MKFLLALIVLLSSFVATAQSRIVSIDAFDLSYTGGLLIKTDKGHSPKREETTFRLNLNYAQNWEKYVGLMFKGKVFFNREDIDWGGDSLSSTWGAAGGFLYNFQADNIKESFYAGVLLGLERQTVEANSRNDESGFNIFTDLEAGKRFDLGQYSIASIAYSPSLAITLKRYGGGIRDEYFKSGNEIKINFLKFDILF